MSRNRFLYICLVLAILFSGAVTPLFQPSVAVAAQPATPTNISPSDGAVGVSLTPPLTSSAFVDDPGDMHLASQWQITTTAGDYSSPVFNSTDATYRTSIAVSSGVLGYSTTYYWHVRYLDSNVIWSDYSPETSFTTTGPQPNQPSNILPTGSGVSLTPTLQSSAFSDNNTLDTHSASQWQITTISGDYASPVFDSVTYSPNLTSTTVPAATLGYTTTYYWRVKHQDNNLDWSAWSAETFFTTTGPEPNQPSNVSPTGSGVSLTPTLQSSAFSDNNTLDTHAASQWQITTISGDYASPVFDSVTYSPNLTSTTVPAATLGYTTTYYWRVRHQDNNLDWSAWSGETSFTTASAPNQVPNRPNNELPLSGATGINLTPTLQSSLFSDNNTSDTHSASQWQITTSSGDYTTGLVYDSGTDTANKTSTTVPSGELGYTTTYYWHVKHQDNNLDWSEWSAETSFTTTGPQPNQPINVSPMGAGVSLTPTLQSSLFSDNNTSDTHSASQWQITTISGDYTTALVYNSGTDTANLVSIVVPSGRLSYSVTYYWHVRHQDNNLEWSAWSAETSFATSANQLPNRPNNVSPTGTGVGLTPTLQSSGFTDPDPGDTHAASWWQVTMTAGNYSNPVFDNVSVINLMTIAVPPDTLSYSTPYYWRVKHEDNNGGWSDWSVETTFITGPPGPGADFAADVTALIAGQSVQFTDASTGQIVSWQWDFGDGTTPTTWTATTKPLNGKISHTYAVAGAYTVSLKIYSGGTYYTEAKPSYINVFALPQAGFSASATGILLGDAVTFTSLSTGGVPPLTYAWDLDSDGVVDSTSLNPTHTYAAAGAYTVTLKVTDSRGNSATEMKTGYIVVGNAIAPHSIPPQGGIIQTADGRIALTFPAEAVAGVATISIEPASPPAATKLPGGFRMGNTCFTLSAVDGEGKDILMFARLVTITVKYSDEDVAAAGGDLNDLVLAYYNEATGKWKVVDTTLNRTDKSLSVSTTHFSTWAVMAKTSSNGLASWQWVIIGLAAILAAGVVMWKLIPARGPYRTR